MKQFGLFFMIILLASCQNSALLKTGLEGKPMPEFQLLLADSSTVINSRNIPAGKSIALFYFNPYCPYCREQTREIIDDMDKLKDIRFYFVTRYPVQDLKSFNKEYQLEKYSNIVAGVDVTGFISDYFEVEGVPYIAMYKKDKMLQKTFLGKAYSSQLKRAAEE